MNSTQHSTCNRVLAPPKGDDNCRPLPVTDTDFYGVRTVCSFWLPTADELALLNTGKPVALFVMGSTHPPLYVGVADSL
jgi:hypothetical protein